jgi:diguanylate cyclase (GGDEF)-like protein
LPRTLLSLDGQQSHQGVTALKRWPVRSRELAKSLSSARPSSRLGGDEFAVILAGPTSTEGNEHVAEKLRQHFQIPTTLSDGQAVQIGFSIGTALFGDGISAQQAGLEADSALYADKRRRKTLSGA